MYPALQLHCPETGLHLLLDEHAQECSQFRPNFPGGHAENTKGIILFNSNITLIRVETTALNHTHCFGTQIQLILGNIHNVQ